jgi:hypothetical protein
MNKLAPLLLLLFACSLPSGTPASLRPAAGLTLAAPVPNHLGRVGLLTRRLPPSASAVRALARLLRAYAEPVRPAAVVMVATGAPYQPFAYRFV